MLTSPRTIWVMTPPTIVRVSPRAAKGVKLGLIRKADGKIKPKPPRNSNNPITGTTNAGTWFTQAILAANSSTGVISFMAPAITKAKPNNTYSPHNTLFIPLSPLVLPNPFCSLFGESPRTQRRGRDTKAARTHGRTQSVAWNTPNRRVTLSSLEFMPFPKKERSRSVQNIANPPDALIQKGPGQGLGALRYDIHSGEMRFGAFLLFFCKTFGPQNTLFPLFQKPTNEVKAVTKTQKVIVRASNQSKLKKILRKNKNKNHYISNS